MQLLELKLRLEEFQSNKEWKLKEKKKKGKKEPRLYQLNNKPRKLKQSKPKNKLTLDEKDCDISIDECMVFIFEKLIDLYRI